MWKWITGLLLLGLCGQGCQPDSYEQQQLATLAFRQQAFSQQDGPCGKDGNPACVTLSISYPQAEGGGEIGDSINQFLRGYLTQVLGTMMPESSHSAHIETLAEQFISDYTLYRKEFPQVNVPWNMDIRGEVLYHGAQYLCLKIHHQEQLGEKGPEGWSSLLVFDLLNGTLLDRDGLLPASQRVMQVVEAQFRRATNMLPKDSFVEKGFSRLESSFSLPHNLGRTDDAILFHYNPHELGPTAKGEVAFSIPVDDLLRDEIATRKTP